MIMYWEEAIEIIKQNQSPPPYQYKDGTLKTSYLRVDECPPKFKKIIDEYHSKYNLKDIQLFASLGQSEGIGEHSDPCNVLIICLEGEMSYSVEKSPLVVLRPGDTLYIKNGLRHLPVSCTIPRICLSVEVLNEVPREEVTYYFG